MRAKFVLRFYSQLARLLCKNSICHNDECELLFLKNKNSLIKSMGSTQQGASTLILALFVVVVLVTAMAGLILGHNLGYQRGYHSMNKETQQALTSSKEAIQELEDLRLSNKIALNQAATAKQELAISLANVKKLRESKQELTTENKKLSQLNDVYAETLSGKGGMPLQVLGANINPLPENAFEYKFDIGMLANDGRSKLLTPTLILLNDDNFVEVPLDHPVDMIEGIVRIRGRFIMPSNFKPLQVKLSLEADGQEVEQLYDWKNGARVNNMPLSLLELPEVDDSPIEP